ncbi:MAG: aspartyl/glutamyl-tRNA amidotransferase subunit C [Candidatus Niyogibacteria bacterium]|nr:aspartyl/glutamyl-tRNA amidotransferase subunit C [Candidatus Niyogibacteria bacterium]
MDIEKISQLARLKLNDQEKETLSKELNSILAYIDKLKESDVREAPPAQGWSASGGEDFAGAFNDLREDEVPPAQGGSLPTGQAGASGGEDLVEASPEKARGFIKVKGVFDVQN